MIAIWGQSLAVAELVINGYVGLGRISGWGFNAISGGYTYFTDMDDGIFGFIRAAWVWNRLGLLGPMRYLPLPLPLPFPSTF
jgi:hypothetical protein